MNTFLEVDPLYEQAVEITVKNNLASISLLQRHLSIGYNHAAGLVERMEAAGIVTPMQSDGTREVIAPVTFDSKWKCHLQQAIDISAKNCKVVESDTIETLRFGFYLGATAALDLLSDRNLLSLESKRVTKEELSNFMKTSG